MTDFVTRDGGTHIPQRVGARLAYADPPYPGRAHLYRHHPDYNGEVDHHDLITRLKTYDGWALSTNAESIHWILPLAPEARVLAWVKHTVTVSWEPVLVKPARQPDRTLRDWIQVEPDNYQWRPKPDEYVIGQKPEAFCAWMFGWLGAEPGDALDDLFPGSGSVSRAWAKWQQQPSLLLARSPQAEKRFQRRELVKQLADHPTLEDIA